MNFKSGQPGNALKFLSTIFRIETEKFAEKIPWYFLQDSEQKILLHDFWYLSPFSRKKARKLKKFDFFDFWRVTPQ